MSEKETLSRRDLLRQASALTLVMALQAEELRAELAPAPTPAGPPVGMGVVGLGPHGRELLTSLSRLPGAPVAGGFGGGAPLFHVDGTTVVGTDTDFTDPQARNSRFWNALQILADLNLIVFDQEEGYRPTPEGDVWLADELARAGGP